LSQQRISSTSFKNASDLAYPAVESRLAGYMFCFCFLFLTITVRPIISKSTGPIFAKFLGLVELWLRIIDLKLSFFDPS